SLLLVSKSHFLVADELASFSDNLSTLRRTQPVQARGSAARVTPKATTFLKIFTKHRKNERGFPSWPIREFRDRSDGIPESGREDSIFRGAGAFFGRTDREQLPPPISSMAEWTRS